MQQWRRRLTFTVISVLFIDAGQEAWALVLDRRPSRARLGRHVPLWASTVFICEVRLPGGVIAKVLALRPSRSLLRTLSPFLSGLRELSCKPVCVVSTRSGCLFFPHSGNKYLLSAYAVRWVTRNPSALIEPSNAHPTDGRSIGPSSTGAWEWGSRGHADRKIPAEPTPTTEWETQAGRIFHFTVCSRMSAHFILTVRIICPIPTPPHTNTRFEKAEGLTQGSCGDHQASSHQRQVRAGVLWLSMEPHADFRGSVMANVKCQRGQAAALSCLVKRQLHVSVKVFFRWDEHLNQWTENWSPSILYSRVGHIQSVGGRGRKDLDAPGKKEFGLQTAFWLKATTSADTWISSLLACPADFRLGSPHNHKLIP